MANQKKKSYKTERKVSYKSKKKSKKEKTMMAISISIIILAILAISYIGFDRFDIGAKLNHQDLSVISYRNTTTNITENRINISGNLEGGYVDYIPFVDHQEQTRLKLTFLSEYPITVYFILNDSDYEAFMSNQTFRVYPNCFFVFKTNSTINCQITTGGIIIYNPTHNETNFEVIGY